MDHFEIVRTANEKDKRRMTKSQILLVEDSAETQLFVRLALQNFSHVTCVESATTAIAALKSQTYSLIILDIELQEGDGFNLCARLRLDHATKYTPIFFLTGRSDPSDKVTAFKLGADDYLVKPFEPLEFKARIEAKLLKIQDQIQKNEVYSKGAFTIFPAMQKASITFSSAEQSLDLTPIEFKLLYYFLQHEEHVLSREQILNVLWGNGRNVSDRTVDTHVYTLRQKLGSFSLCIQSVPRIGYKFSQIEMAQSKPA